jgi:hypothetical protein
VTPLPGVPVQASKRAQSRQYQLWEEDELRDLAAAVGLVGFSRTRSFRYIMFSAAKPRPL